MARIQQRSKQMTQFKRELYKTFPNYGINKLKLDESPARTIQMITRDPLTSKDFMVISMMAKQSQLIPEITNITSQWMGDQYIEVHKDTICIDIYLLITYNVQAHFLSITWYGNYLPNAPK